MKSIWIFERFSLIENEGYELLAHYTLLKSSWRDNFYRPIEKSITKLKEKYHNNKITLQVFAECEREIYIYHTYSDYFFYEFFIMQKPFEERE